MERNCEKQPRTRGFEKQSTLRKGKRKRSRDGRSSSTPDHAMDKKKKRKVWAMSSSSVIPASVSAKDAVRNKSKTKKKKKKKKNVAQRFASLTSAPSWRYGANAAPHFDLRDRLTQRGPETQFATSPSLSSHQCGCGQMTDLQRRIRSLPVERDVTLDVKTALDETVTTTTTCETESIKIDPNNVVAVDCEMVGVGWRMESALGRCSIVDSDGSILLDTYVVPPAGIASITDYRTRYSGIRPSHLRGALAYDDAVSRARDLLRGRIVVGHALENDFQVLGFRVPDNWVRDTSKYSRLFALAEEMASQLAAQSVGPANALSTPKVTKGLKSLTRHILGRKIQGKQHDSVEDARASLDLYMRVREDWESELSSSRGTESPREEGALCLRCRGVGVTRARRKLPSRATSTESEGVDENGRPGRTRAMTETSEEIAEFVQDRYWHDFPDAFS